MKLKVKKLSKKTLLPSKIERQSYPANDKERENATYFEYPTDDQPQQLVSQVSSLTMSSFAAAGDSKQSIYIVDEIQPVVTPSTLGSGTSSGSFFVYDEDSNNHNDEYFNYYNANNDNDNEEQNGTNNESNNLSKGTKLRTSMSKHLNKVKSSCKTPSIRSISIRRNQIENYSPQVQDQSVVVVEDVAHGDTGKAGTTSVAKRVFNIRNKHKSSALLNNNEKKKNRMKSSASSIFRSVRDLRGDGIDRSYPAVVTETETETETETALVVYQARKEGEGTDDSHIIIKEKKEKVLVKHDYSSPQYDDDENENEDSYSPSSQSKRKRFSTSSLRISKLLNMDHRESISEKETTATAPIYVSDVEDDYDDENYHQQQWVDTTSTYDAENPIVKMKRRKKLVEYYNAGTDSVSLLINKGKRGLDKNRSSTAENTGVSEFFCRDGIFC